MHVSLSLNTTPRLLGALGFSTGVGSRFNVVRYGTIAVTGEFLSVPWTCRFGFGSTPLAFH